MICRMKRCRCRSAAEGLRGSCPIPHGLPLVVDGHPMRQRSGAKNQRGASKANKISRNASRFELQKENGDPFRWHGQHGHVQKIIRNHPDSGCQILGETGEIAHLSAMVLQAWGTGSVRTRSQNSGIQSSEGSCAENPAPIG